MKIERSKQLLPKQKTSWLLRAYQTNHYPSFTYLDSQHVLFIETSLTKFLIP
ncbi:hypothetical protein PVK62_00305 [Aliivibrio sp. S3MY1]|uniref:hypothetical protein n=1 Tax=unclassified Aliivibrio TaxID=2645654 RepID=UPI002377FE45|nr:MULTISPECIES: hypothetical protein [unclassified Aliivibrio]MDD9194276.1 hypothetical protein [Aliivibrio sp. S3MY1]MDD9197943.1 hypothetical protein [Aliivibrio sp. S2MY1]